MPIVAICIGLIAFGFTQEKKRTTFAYVTFVYNLTTYAQADVANVNNWIEAPLDEEVCDGGNDRACAIQVYEGYCNGTLGSRSIDPNYVHIATLHSSYSASYYVDPIWSINIFQIYNRSIFTLH